MKKYKVLKEFVNDLGNLLTVDNGYIERGASDKVTKALVENGFIEEVKEPANWRAHPYTYYWKVNSQAKVVNAPDGTGSGKSDRLYELGNYFKSEETAEKVAAFLQEAFNQLHNPEDRYYRTPNYICLFDEARKAVLADDKGDK